MINIYFKGIIPQQRFLNYSVQGNNNADKIKFIVEATQTDIDLSTLTPYVKVQSAGGSYIDKIRLTATPKDNTLEMVWTMTRKSLQCRNLSLQLQFEDERNDHDIVWQSAIAQIELFDTIKADKPISEQNATIIQQLSGQVDGFEDRLAECEREIAEGKKVVLNLAFDYHIYRGLFCWYNDEDLELLKQNKVAYVVAEGAIEGRRLFISMLGDYPKLYSVINGKFIFVDFAEAEDHKIECQQIDLEVLESRVAELEKKSVPTEDIKLTMSIYGNEKGQAILGNVRFPITEEEGYDYGIEITSSEIRQDIIEEINKGLLYVRFNYPLRNGRNKDKGNVGFNRILMKYEHQSREWIKDEELFNYLIKITRSMIKTNERGGKYISFRIDFTELLSKVVELSNDNSVFDNDIDKYMPLMALSNPLSVGGGIVRDTIIGTIPFSWSINGDNAMHPFVKGKSLWGSSIEARNHYQFIKYDYRKFGIFTAHISNVRSYNGLTIESKYTRSRKYGLYSYDCSNTKQIVENLYYIPNNVYELYNDNDELSIKGQMLRKLRALKICPNVSILKENWQEIIPQSENEFPTSWKHNFSKCNENLIINFCSCLTALEEDQSVADDLLLIFKAYIK